MISGLLVARSLDRGSGITSGCRLVRRSPPRERSVCVCVLRSGVRQLFLSVCLHRHCNQMFLLLGISAKQ